MPARIHPSILTADFGHLAAELKSIESADAVHVDVMDNNFVPNLTFGGPVVKRIAELSRVPLDIHLMIANVDEWAAKYARMGADSVTIHYEASKDPEKCSAEIRASGAKSALAISPRTTFAEVRDLLSHFDMLLVMTVEPGFGGQALIAETLDKVALAREHFDSHQLSLRLQVDGGITGENIAQIAALGADTFVAGSFIFNSADRAAAIVDLRNLATVSRYA